jgi:hypothetical protein
MADMAIDSRSARRGPAGVPVEDVWRPPDTRRMLQLALAAIWLLDAVLQYQSFMFTKAFGQMLGGTAAGNPGVIAGPISWDAHLVEQHDVLLNSIFATVQLLIAIGIACRPTVKLALAASIAWSLAVWWLGEGLGEVLTGSASPVNGAPGAVILYALLAVLLWPHDRQNAPPARFIAARAVGLRTAKVLWLILWGSLAYFAVLPANRTPQGLHDMIAGMADGEPGWLMALENHAAALVAHHGLAVSVALAVLLAVIAIGVFLPAPAARTAIVVAVVVSGAIWIIGQALGEIFTRGGTDPNSGPLLILLALAFWPLRTPATGSSVSAEVQS